MKMMPASMSPRLRIFVLGGASVIFAFLFISVTMRDRLPSVPMPAINIPKIPKMPSFPIIGHGGGDKECKPKKDFKEVPDWLPPPIVDPFPLLQHSKPPPIPKWNQPKPDAHKKYDLPVAPPLLIGFTRTWPILLQCVVSYITAGWPADQIYVIENTGVQWANKMGNLTLQNPFYLNHTQLGMLGVNIIQTPVLLNFAQLQNFFLHLTHEHDWPYFYWTHSDSLAFSWEDGLFDQPLYNSSDYRTMYELAMEVLQDARKNDPKWAARLFAYDHLAAVNPVAYEENGGWDTLIPYYMTDCDFHARLLISGYTMLEKPVGHVMDVNTALKDLLALYRVPGVEVKYVDPNPPPSPPAQRFRRDGEAAAAVQLDPNLVYYKSLLKTGDDMIQYKGRGRNTWQASQRGGVGEPFYYPSEGIAEGIEIITQAGRDVFARKWGHRDCDIQNFDRVPDDAWKLKPDWVDGDPPKCNT